MTLVTQTIRLRDQQYWSNSGSNDLRTLIWHRPAGCFIEIGFGFVVILKVLLMSYHKPWSVEPAAEGLDDLYVLPKPPMSSFISKLDFVIAVRSSLTVFQRVFRPVPGAPINVL